METVIAPMPFRRNEVISTIQHIGESGGPPSEIFCNVDPQIDSESQEHAHLIST